MEKRVRFDLEVDADGYPPVSAEYIWCSSTAQGTYVVDNIPFYARDVSLGDEIATDIADGEETFKEVVRKSANTTVRVFVKDLANTQRYRGELNSLGCITELSEISGMFSVSMPPEAKVADALAFLDRASESHEIGFEESSVRYK